MHDLCLWRKFIQIACDTVIESRAYREQHIAFHLCHIGGIAAVHAGIAYIQRIITRYGTFSHNGCTNRHVHFSCKISKKLLRSRYMDSSACQDKRPLRVLKRLVGTLQLSDMH